MVPTNLTLVGDEPDVSLVCAFSTLFLLDCFPETHWSQRRPLDGKACLPEMILHKMKYIYNKRAKPLLLSFILNLNLNQGSMDGTSNSHGTKGT